MNPFQELVVLLPCHSLEDFPTHYVGADANAILAGWSGLWHPALLASAQALPKWHRADDPPNALPDRLVVIPPPSEPLLSEAWIDQVRGQGASVLRGLSDRTQLVAEALALLGKPVEVDGELARDFLALGFCYLQVELLTRQMRLSSYVDEVELEREAVAAATAAVAGERSAAEKGLKRCFELMLEARDHFYPVDVYLVDVTLVAPTTLGRSLADALRCPERPATNILAAGELIEAMARDEPASLDALRQALDQGTASVVGGEYSERDLTRAGLEGLLAELNRGRQAYEAQLGRPVTIYGRRPFGLSPVLPQVLSKCGFIGALHMALDGSAFPRAEQCKWRWEGVDGTAIDALATLPLDANSSESFIDLARRMGESIESDHVATLVLAHWPGQVSVWHEDLCRIGKYNAVLGRFVTLDDYFHSTDLPGIISRFAADQYRPRYLGSAVAAGETDCVSRGVRQQRHETEAMCSQSLSTLTQLLDAATGRPSGAGEAGRTVEHGAPIEHGAAATTGPGPSDVAVQDPEPCLASRVRDLAGRVAPHRPGGPTGRLVVNPLSFPRQMLVGPPGDKVPATDPVPAGTAAADHPPAAIGVQVPGVGYTWVGPQSPTDAAEGRKRKKKKDPLPLAEELLLRNEFYEVTIQGETGAIQSMRDHTRRGNQLSQQIACRQPLQRSVGDAADDPPARTAGYSNMSADSIAVTRADASVGEITSRGRLMDDDGRPLGKFAQQTQIAMGSRILRVKISIEPNADTGADPWQSYYAARFAWPDETAELMRSVGMSAQLTTARQFEAPHFIEIRSGDHRATILTGGLAFHRLSGPRMLDTLLVVRGESARTFELGIGLDLGEPLSAAIELTAPDKELVTPSGCPTGGASGWLLHTDNRHVILTHFEPLAARGFRIRVLETSGRGGRVRFGSFRDVAQARQSDFLGNPLAELPVEEGKIVADVAGHEWVQIDAEW